MTSRLGTESYAKLLADVHDKMQNASKVLTESRYCYFKKLVLLAGVFRKTVIFSRKSSGFDQRPYGLPLHIGLQGLQPTMG